jgi:phospholipid/cholesterol/gamma-HCH transport system permease protein
MSTEIYGSGPAVPTVAEPARAKRRSAFRDVLAEAGELIIFSGRALKALVGVPRYTSEVLRQTALLVKGTTLMLAVMSAFFGFTLVNYSFFFFRTIGASDYVGVVVGLAGIRVGAIAMFAYTMASKVGCGIVAEIGAAKINEEIDAYEVEGVDPYRFIMGTRIVAAMLYIPIAAMVCLASLTFAGYLGSVAVLHGLSAEQYYSVNWSVIGLQDVLYMFVTMAVTGVLIVLVACFYGWRTSGGPSAVGDAVARSLIVNITLAHVIPALFTMNFYSPEHPNLNIGG